MIEDEENTLYCEHCEKLLNKDGKCKECDAKPKRTECFCQECGEKILSNAVVCPHCGCLQRIDNNVEEKHEKVEHTGAIGVAQVFMILSCILFGVSSLVFIIVLASGIPDQSFRSVLASLLFDLFLFFVSLGMTATLGDTIKNKEHISTAFKVCTLLFVNFISGIILLCDQEKPISSAKDN